MFADVNALWYPLTSYSLPLTSLIVNWLIICHTEITEITDFKQKHFKTAFSLFKCFALLLSVLSSLLVNEFPDSPDNPSNKPMAYEQFKVKNSHFVQKHHAAR